MFWHDPRARNATTEQAQLTLARPAETFGERLRRLRTEQGKPQRQLAGPGVSHAYVSRLEAGTRTASVKAIRMLARRLGVSPEYLETGIDLTAAEELELRLADAQLRVRLGQADDEIRDMLAGLLVDARAAGEPDLVAEAQVMVGVAALAAGDPRSAISNLQEAFDSPLISVSLHAHAYVALADAYWAVGRVRSAIGLLKGAIRELDEPGFDDPVARIRLAALLHEALDEIGDVDRTREVEGEIRQAALAETDLYARVRVWWSLGQAAAAAGRSRTALRALRHAVSSLHVLEEAEPARAHPRARPLRQLVADLLPPPATPRRS